MPWPTATVSRQGSLARSATAPRLHTDERADERSEDFGANAAELLAHELTRTSKTLQHAHRNLDHTRRTANVDAAAREREVRSRVAHATQRARAEERERAAAAIARERQAAAKATAGASAASAMHAQLMQMASQVKKQRATLEKGLAKEVQRADERAAAEDAWAAHVRELEDHLTDATDRAEASIEAAAALEAERDQWHQWYARAAIRRVTRTTLADAWREWSDHARRKRTELKQAAAIGAGNHKRAQTCGRAIQCRRW